MKRATVTVRYSAGGERELRGWALADVPGLVAHRGEGPDGKPDPLGRWNVTHAASGRRLCTRRNRAAALEVIERVGPLADWTEPYATLVAREAEVVPKLTAAIGGPR